MTGFNRTHLAEFLKLSSSPEANEIAELWDGGKRPGSWFASVGYISSFIGTLDPQERLNRAAIWRLIRNERASDADLTMLIFAWGDVSKEREVGCELN
jgi:hypothetical protein